MVDLCIRWSLAKKDSLNGHWSTRLLLYIRRHMYYRNRTHWSQRTSIDNTSLTYVSQRTNQRTTGVLVYCLTMHIALYLSLISQGELIGQCARFRSLERRAAAAPHPTPYQTTVPNMEYKTNVVSSLSVITTSGSCESTQYSIVQCSTVNTIHYNTIASIARLWQRDRASSAILRGGPIWGQILGWRDTLW